MSRSTWIHPSWTRVLLAVALAQVGCTPYAGVPTAGDVTAIQAIETVGTPRVRVRWPQQDVKGFRAQTIPYRTTSVKFTVCDAQDQAVGVRTLVRPVGPGPEATDSVRLAEGTGYRLVAESLQAEDLPDLTVDTSIVRKAQRVEVRLAEAPGDLQDLTHHVDTLVAEASMATPTPEPRVPVLALTSATLGLDAMPADGHPDPGFATDAQLQVTLDGASTSEVVWLSSDPAKLAVDGTGHVQTVAGGPPGMVTVTAISIADSRVRATASVTIEAVGGAEAIAQ